MDTDEAPGELNEPFTIHHLSLDLLFCICDYLSLSDIYHLSKSSRSLRVSLEFHLYITAANLRKRDKRSVWDFVTYAAEFDWNINSFRLVFNAWGQIFGSDLVDYLRTGFHFKQPLLFHAFQNNRLDIVSVIEENPRIFSLLESGWESALHDALVNRNLGLIERFITNPKVLVRSSDLNTALTVRWKPGIAALLACGRLEKAEVGYCLDWALLERNNQDRPSWIEYLLSIGADPRYSLNIDYLWHGVPYVWGSSGYPNCGLHYPRPCVPYCRTVLYRSLIWGCLENVKKLLEIFSFSEDYMIHVLRQCTRGDHQLEITKIILEKTNQNSNIWVEAYAAAARVNGDPRCQNKHTIRYLMGYGIKLQRSGAEFDINKLLEYSGKTILEEFLTHSSQDRVTPLFRFDIDPSLLSMHGWKLFRKYLYLYVNTKEKRDQVLKCCRRTMSYNRYQGVRAILSTANRKYWN